MAEDDIDASRRLEEFEALQAFYGDAVSVADEEYPHLGPWKVNISSSVDLEIVLPLSYPSRDAPTPRILAPTFVLAKQLRKDLEQELVEQYQKDTEVVIMWAEHVRASLGDIMDSKGKDDDHAKEEGKKNATETDKSASTSASASGGLRVFRPGSSKFGQSTRHFDESVLLNPLNKRAIHRGQPLHPPKSGPAETMIAHVASVEHTDHVNWVLAELLFNDKKVARANHNMIAYRFYDPDRGCLVSDNDDDGEKGSGAKLAALLEMADVRNAIVVVSRWYGGVHLGPSRFKYFAVTARNALQEAGFLKDKK